MYHFDDYSFCAVGMSVTVNVHEENRPHHLFTGSKLLPDLYSSCHVNALGQGSQHHITSILGLGIVISYYMLLMVVHA